MRIGTAPTIFDGLEREKVIAWLEQEPTIALMAAIDQRIGELEEYLRKIDIGASDTAVATAYRTAQAYLSAHVLVQDFIRQAGTRAREVQHGKA